MRVRELSEDDRHQPDLLSEAASTDAQALLHAAEPTDRYHPTAAESDRLFTAHLVVGAFHLARLQTLGARRQAGVASVPDSAIHRELAASIALFRPYAIAVDDHVPPPLRPLVGPSRRVEAQFMTAAEFLGADPGEIDPVVLDVGIALMTAALVHLPEEHPLLPIGRSTLSEAYETRFLRRGDATDLRHAITISDIVLARTRTDDQDYPMFLSKMRRLYHHRYEMTHAVDDLRRALETAEQSVRMTAPGDPMLGRRLNILGELHRRAFIRTEETHHADLAVEMGAQAVAAAVPGHAEYAVRLSNLSLSHLERHRGTGDPDDLETAVEMGEQAVRATPDGDDDLVGTLANTAGAHLARFQAHGDAAALDRAIELGERAAACGPGTDLAYPMYLSNLAVARRRRFERTRDPADADRAVEAGEQAAGAVADDPIKLPHALSALAAAYRARYRHAADPTDLDKAIITDEINVSVMPENHPRRALDLANLASLHITRYTANHDEEDARKAVELGERAIAATPDGHTSLPMTVMTLCGAYTARYGDAIAEHAGRVRRLASALATARTASPVNRVAAGRAVGTLAALAEDWRTAVGSWDEAVSLLPVVAAPRADRSDREYLLGQGLDLVGGAVASHLAVDDAVGAVELAELGRGVMLAAELDSRSDLTDLRAVDAALADRFEQVRVLLEPAAGDDGESGADHPRRRLWREYDHLLEQIRALPGLHRFLLPPAYEDLRMAVAGGVAVLVNADRRRGDAVIVTPQVRRSSWNCRGCGRRPTARRSSGRSCTVARPCIPSGSGSRCSPRPWPGCGTVSCPRC
ncbi:hypothetical protein [Saccharothrix sp. HUAS TT1]|uniref:hypothetical protein n=1 Tax=unclassified Saccharothrix TaxID=2593673 RepID=UPI00345B599E